MMVRRLAIGLVVVMAFVAGVVWQRQASTSSASRPAAAPPGTEAPAMPGMPPGEAVAEPSADVKPGLVWTVPGRWRTLGERPMRVATYAVPAVAGDAEDGECAVFHFGPSQGGGVEDNISRWVSQFENAGPAQQTTMSVRGLRIHRVQVHGDFLAPSGPMMVSSGTKKGFMLIGAIVEGPAGGVFFKLTGPEKTVLAAAKEFDRMMESIQKG
jgi:hypothetical protein